MAQRFSYTRYRGIEGEARSRSQARLFPLSYQINKRLTTLYSTWSGKTRICTNTTEPGGHWRASEQRVALLVGHAWAHSVWPDCGSCLLGWASSTSVLALTSTR